MQATCTFNAATGARGAGLRTATAIALMAMLAGCDLLKSGSLRGDAPVDIAPPPIVAQAARFPVAAVAVGAPVAAIIESARAGDDALLPTQKYGRSYRFWPERLAAPATLAGIDSRTFIASGRHDLSGRNDSLAMDASGTAVSVWIANNGGQLELHSSRYLASSDQWTPSERLVMLSGAPSYRVAMDGFGRALVVWQEPLGLVRSRAYLPQQGWLAETVVSPDPQWRLADLAMRRSQGHVALIGTNGDLAIARMDNFAWQPPVTVGDGVRSVARLAFHRDAPDDALTVVWARADGIFVNRLAATGPQTPAGERVPGSGANDGEPQVVMGANQELTVTWVNLRFELRANRAVAGTWGSVETLVDSAEGPRLAGDALGNAAVAWSRGASVRVRRFVRGSGWLPTETLFVGMVFGGAVDLAMDDAGRGLVVWEEAVANLGRPSDTRTVAAVIGAPTARFAVMPATPRAGVPFTLDATASSDPGGSIVTTQWDFGGDGQPDLTPEGAVVTARFDTPGTYPVSVFVTDNSGLVATLRREIVVAANPATQPPTIDVAGQPADTSVAEPAAARFTVAAQGSAPLAFRWQRSDDGGASFVDLTAATAAELVTGATSVADRPGADDDGDLYRVIVSNAFGSATSRAARLTVSATIVAPLITTQPQSVSVLEGGSATFSTVASGTAPSFQWQRSGDGTNWTDIAGATNASYTLANVQTADNGALFRVRATNSAGTATSNAATLTVTAPPPPSTGAGRIAAGNGFSLAVNAAGVPYSWGADGTGQLGNGTPNADRNLAAPVGAFNAVRAVAAGGGSQAIALRTDGTVWAWGYGGSVTCDFGATFPVPVQIGGASGIVAISTGDAHTLLLRNDGVVLAFGCNDSGQLGRAGTAPAASAVMVAGLPPITAVAAGGALSLALDASGNVWSWGRGALGDSSGLFAPRNTPAQIAGLTGVAAIAAASDHALALRSNGSVWAWGSNLHGKLGLGSNVASQLTPAATGLVAGITAIAAGGDNAMALRSDGVVLVAGINETAQLGVPTPGFSNAWLAVPGVANAVAIAAGAQTATSHLFALRADGSVIGWGWNRFGEVGRGTTGSILLPAPVTGLNLN